MNDSRIFSLISFVGLMTFLFFGCTSNPIGDDEIGRGKITITGEIQLEHHDPEDVFIWLEGFRIGERADAEGNFEITIPPGTNSEVSGLFTIFFYVENYLLDSRDVAVRNGEFVFGDLDVSSDGAVVPEISLRQFLSIRTELEPEKVTANSNQNIRVTVTLRTTLADTATVVIPNTVPGAISRLFIRNLDTGEITLYEAFPTGTRDEELIVSTAEQKRTVSFEFLNLPLPVGQYEFIPYLLLQHQAIPAGLKGSIAPNVDEFGPTYLQLPFKRNGGDFEVE